MKEPTKLLLAILIFVSPLTKSQNQTDDPPLTDKRRFDTLFDRFGNKYLLRDLLVNSPNKLNGQPKNENTTTPGKTLGNSQTINATPSLSCSAGYFDMYFAPGSCFDGSSAQAIAMRNTICQLFSDISAFIIAAPSAQINILCDDTPSSMPFALGTASSFYSFPLMPQNANQGIIQNQIQKALISNVDPFATLPGNAFPGANNFYYGYVNANPNPPFAWNMNWGTTAIPPNEFDFYTVMLHEVTHALGFASLIDNTGLSRFGAAHNMFSTYDLFLYDQIGNPLLGPSNPFCPHSNLTYQLSPTVVSPGSCVNTSGNIDITVCSQAVEYVGSTNVKCYTPNCYEPGSSLSHFEDMCTVPGSFVASPPCFSGAGNSNNNLYYVMSNAQSTGPCYVKRHLTEEERLVLCDLGYQVQQNYSSPIAGANYGYMNPMCSGSNIWGDNDGLGVNTYLHITNINTALTLNIGSDILWNDSPMATNISCVEEIYGDASVIMTGSGLPGDQVIVTPNTGFSGLLILKYIPQNAMGQSGNATYIYVYVLPGNCNPPNSCEMVQNAGFEVTTGTFQCSQMNAPWSPPILACWEAYEQTPDLFTRNCTTFSNLFNLGNNTYNTVPAYDAFQNPLNGSPNDRIIGLGANTYNGLREALKNNLSSPLIPSQQYNLSFWTSNYSGPGYVTFNTNANPIVVTICSAPNFAVTGGGYPTGLNIVAEFTVPASNPATSWQYISQVITFTGTTNHNCLLIGIDAGKTSALGGNANQTYGTAHYLLMLDEISLVPVPTPTFALQSQTLCVGSSVTNLSQYASPIPGTFSGPGITTNGSDFDFNVPATLPAGNYPIAFTYTNSNGCVKTLWQNIVLVAPGITLSTSGNTTYCSNAGGNVALSVSANPSSGVSFLWEPGSLPGANINVSPSANTTYTIYATPPNGCTTTVSLLVSVQNNCCPQSTLGMAVINSITGPASLSGGVIYNPITLTGPGITFGPGEYLMAPQAAIVISAGSQLQLQGVHMYACGLEMWQGIDVLSGGSIVSPPPSGPTNCNLIEDAYIAIELDNINTNQTSLEIAGIIFNKNDVGIRIANSTFSQLDYFVRACVFTSRDLPHTPVWWPNSTTNSPDLRYAAPGATLGLSPPYTMGSYPYDNLNFPYTMRGARVGVLVENINVVPGALPSAGVGFPNPTIFGGSAADFNLFDHLSEGFLVNDASLGTVNNVFQNMQFYQVNSGPGAPYMMNGTGIRHNCSSNMNARLNLVPSGMGQQALDFGNRFWNVPIGILARDVYEFQMEYAMFRSDQNTSTIGAFGVPGSFGVYSNTNRFSYNLSRNEFINLSFGLHLRNSNAAFDMGSGPNFGVYADQMLIEQNYFGPEVTSTTPLAPGTEFMHRAIDIFGPNSLNWMMAGPGIQVQSNKINRALRGISVIEMGGVVTGVNANLISLDDDTYTGSRQYGIEIVRTTRNISVLENTITATGHLNRLVDEVFCDGNSGPGSPLILCNDLSQGYNGFVFNGSNSGTIWWHNRMQQLERGMVLQNNGQIGPQGGPGFPQDNEWNGTWMGTDYTTWTDGSSPAPASSLYHQPPPPFAPVNNGGGPGNYNSPGALFPTGGSNPCVPGIYPTVPTQRPEAPTTLENTLFDEWNATVYPNPSTNLISIFTSNNSDLLNVRITDMTGKILLSESLNSNANKVEISTNLPNGIYIIEINNGANKTIHSKVIVQR